jgi:hypothetical protein
VSRGIPHRGNWAWNRINEVDAAHRGVAGEATAADTSRNLVRSPVILIVSQWGLGLGVGERKRQQSRCDKMTLCKVVPYKVLWFLIDSCNPSFLIMVDRAWAKPAKERLCLAGTNDDLPEELREIIGLPDHQRVTAWASHDPNQGALAMNFSTLLEPFWLVLSILVLSFLNTLLDPIYLWSLLVILVSLMVQYFHRLAAFQHRHCVLSENYLYMITRQRDSCSLMPGCFKDGNVVQSIPLEVILDCEVTEPAPVCGLFTTPSKLFVRTMISRPLEDYEHSAVGLANYRDFAQSVLNQRDLVREGAQTKNATTLCWLVWCAGGTGLCRGWHFASTPVLRTHRVK